MLFKFVLPYCTHDVFIFIHCVFVCLFQTGLWIFTPHAELYMGRKLSELISENQGSYNLPTGNETSLWTWRAWSQPAQGRAANRHSWPECAGHMISHNMGQQPKLNKELGPCSLCVLPPTHLRSFSRIFDSEEGQERTQEKDTGLSANTDIWGSITKVGFHADMWIIRFWSFWKVFPIISSKFFLLHI